MVHAERVTPVLTHHGEGACWSEQWGGLRFVDLYAGDVCTLREDGSVDRIHVGPVAACVRPRVGGGAIIATERGVLLEDSAGALDPFPAARPAFFGETSGLRMNEGGCDPQGRFYIGSMAYDQTDGRGDGRASLYRLGADGVVAVVLPAVTISNGLGFSPDGTLAYYNDTPTGRIDVFDVVDGDLRERRPFARVHGERSEGHPDGLCVDAEGGVWTALFGGSGVHRYAPDGSLSEVVEVGARQVTSCTFGGAELEELWITTSRENLEDDDDPAAGSLFRFPAGVRGLAALPFAG
ncbi:SMP-30/gluconolactonase/LRE family protein [Kineococcus gynurae]|uniref:SMP-30/gluconolactonase/LRE family protein n=1 Tax=Kineococcus gynurae TaxID=452979 RepID=A0ABV5LTV1_9ACTN